MNTKQIPAITALVAGLVICLIAFAIQMSLVSFLELFCAVIVGFYLLGLVVKLVLDRGFASGAHDAPGEALEEAVEEDMVSEETTPPPTGDTPPWEGNEELRD